MLGVLSFIMFTVVYRRYLTIRFFHAFLLAAWREQRPQSVRRYGDRGARFLTQSLTEAPFYFRIRPE